MHYQLPLFMLNKCRCFCFLHRLLRPGTRSMHCLLRACNAFAVAAAAVSGSRVAMATAAPPCAAAAQRRLASQAAPSAGRKRPFSSTSAGRVDEVGSVVFQYLSVTLTVSRHVYLRFNVGL